MISYMGYKLISASAGRTGMFSDSSTLLEQSYYRLYFSISDVI